MPPTTGQDVLHDRAHSHLPWVMPLLVAAVATPLAVASLAETPFFLVLSLALAVVVMSWGWAGTLALPTPRGTAGVLAIGGLAMVAAVATREVDRSLTWVPAAIGVSMLAAFLHQLLRRDGRPRVVESVSSVVLGLSVIASGVILVPLSASELGGRLIVIALVAATLSALTDLAGHREALIPWLAALAMVVGGAAGLLLAGSWGIDLVVGACLGVLSASLSHAVRAVLRPLPTLTHPRPQLVTAVASVLVVAIGPFLAALIILRQLG